jgi:hypothetical protein
VEHKLWCKRSEAEAARDNIRTLGRRAGYTRGRHSEEPAGLVRASACQWSHAAKSSLRSDNMRVSHAQTICGPRDVKWGSVAVSKEPGP